MNWYILIFKLKKMKKCLCFFCLAVLIQGCASLSKSQIESVNQFAKTTQNFSAFPSHIMSELAEIRLARSLYYANSLSDANLHIDELDSSYEQNIFDNAMSTKVDITFMIIDKYAQSLLLLSSDKFGDDLVDQAKSFGIGIDSLVTLNNAIVGNEKLPRGIGAAVSQLVVIGGKQYIRIKQAKEIKKFVSIADTLVNTMCSHLLTFLKSSTIEDFIKGDCASAMSASLKGSGLSRWKASTPRAS